MGENQLINSREEEKEEKSAKRQNFPPLARFCRSLFTPQEQLEQQQEWDSSWELCLEVLRSSFCVCGAAAVAHFHTTKEKEENKREEIAQNFIVTLTRDLNLG